ncbi:MAG TPA: hydrogenase maturation protease [Myxococcales bacterium]|jgi:hydrogenase maturation protease|nr:hydrogenase maturation protease [Myxococcales bacterium]
MKVLVAGIGNIFFGDDAFGVEVAQRLLQRRLPEGVVVKDFGIRGLELTYALTDGWGAAILLDAAPRGGAPGTLYVLDTSNTSAAPELDPHEMHPARVLAMAREIGKAPKIVRVVGCEPASASEMEMGLSPQVAAAIDPACALVEELLAELR